jgi:hypothetical protein
MSRATYPVGVWAIRRRPRLKPKNLLRRYGTVPRCWHCGDMFDPAQTGLEVFCSGSCSERFRRDLAA